MNDSHVPLPEPDVLARLIVPGWAHIHAGLGIRGQRVPLGLPPVALIGPFALGHCYTGSILLGLAFSVHASSVMDILIRQGTVRFPRMMATAALVSLVLAVLIYFPAGQLLMRVAAPIEFATDTDLFKRLDVVLVNRWAFALTGSPARRRRVVQPAQYHRDCGPPITSWAMYGSRTKRTSSSTA